MLTTAVTEGWHPPQSDPRQTQIAEKGRWTPAPLRVAVLACRRSLWPFPVALRGPLWKEAAHGRPESTQPLPVGADPCARVLGVRSRDGVRIPARADRGARRLEGTLPIPFKTFAVESVFLHADGENHASPHDKASPCAGGSALDNSASVRFNCRRSRRRLVRASAARG